MYRSTHYRLMRWLSYFVVSMAVLLSGSARAQDVLHPIPTRDFRIPYNVDNNGQGLVGIYLYVSQDHGQTYKWVEPGAAPNRPPEQRYFVFHAAADGEYWFVVQTLDTRGGYQPPQPAKAQPSLKVFVDTQKPRILSFKQATPQDGSPAAVEWIIEDDNFASVFLEYRAQGTNEKWYPVPTAVQSARTTQGFSPVINGPLDVHLRVQDRGGNVEQAYTTVTPAPGRQTAQALGQAPTAPDNGPRIMYVNSKTFQLDYSFDEASVGPSGIKHVEIYSTHDEGNSWQPAPQSAPRNGPCKFTVEKDGRWGFILVPVSGVGLSGDKPRPKDVAQLWVEVDEIKPTVAFLGAPAVGKGTDAGFLIINWRASDAFLRRDGITISYREKPEQAWIPLPGAQRVANTGSFRARTSDLPYQFYVQIKAIDEAGNEGEAVTEQPVKVDLTVPRIKNLSVQPAAMSAGGGMPSSGMTPSPKNLTVQPATMGMDSQPPFSPPQR